MVPPTTPGPIRLLGAPPMTFGAPLVFGSIRNARMPLTFSSSGWLSAVPRKFTPAVVPLLPPVFQKLELFAPPSVAAFRLVKPAPLPANAPLKKLAALLKVTAALEVPAGGADGSAAGTCAP